MTRQRTFAFAHHPTSLPVLPTLIILLLDDRFHPTDFWCGVIWVLVALWWVFAVYVIVTEKHGTPIFHEDLKPGAHVLLFPENRDDRPQ